MLIVATLPHTNKMDFQPKTLIGSGVFVNEPSGDMGKELGRVLVKLFNWHISCELQRSFCLFRKKRNKSNWETMRLNVIFFHNSTAFNKVLDRIKEVLQ